MKNTVLILFASLFCVSVYASEIGDDGLHKQPWLEATFKDIGEDIDFAREQNKRLAILFEQRGCPFCTKMHETVWIDPAIVSYIEDNYIVVQYNLHGAEEVTDLDGEVLTESAIAKKWGLQYTPTLLFLPDTLEPQKSADKQTVATMPGATDKATTFSMLRWVAERGYETDESFQNYHQRRLEKLNS